MIRNGQQVPVYPAQNSENTSFCPEFVNALMGAYKVVFYAPKLMNKSEKFNKLTQKLASKYIELAMKSSYTHLNARINKPA